MDSSKKIYILIGVLIAAVLILFLVMFFGRGGVLPTKEEKLPVSLCPEQVTYQGEAYNTIEIGNQCWLAENLRTSAFRDGTPIANLTVSSEWAEDKQGAYACYYNLPQNCESYGVLYNWYAVSNEKGLCPEGWSVPSQEQWAEADCPLKAVLGGFRNAAGPFDFLDEKGFFWTATPSGDFAYAMIIEKDSSEMRKIESSKSSGFSVRCVMD